MGMPNSIATVLFRSQQPLNSVFCAVETRSRESWRGFPSRASHYLRGFFSHLRSARELRTTIATFVRLRRRASVRLSSLKPPGFHP